MNTENRMLHQLMHVGELLLISGAEIRRVEETISRMGKGNPVIFPVPHICAADASLHYMEIPVCRCLSRRGYQPGIG